MEHSGTEGKLAAPGGGGKGQHGVWGEGGGGPAAGSQPPLPRTLCRLSQQHEWRCWEAAAQKSH